MFVFISYGITEILSTPGKCILMWSLFSYFRQPVCYFLWWVKVRKALRQINCPILLATLVILLITESVKSADLLLNSFILIYIYSISDYLLLTSINLSSTLSALPESISSAANFIPSARLSAFPPI